MKLYKKIAAFLFCGFTIILANDVEEILNSPILHLIDGITGLMDEHTICKTLHLGRELSKLQLGNVDSVTKKRVAQYSYNGKLYTLKELVKLEKEWLAANSDGKSPFDEILQKIKGDFEAATNPFMKEARGTRQHMIRLIEDWSKLRKRTDSQLLKWSEGTENESFRRDVNTLEKLDVFCTDLTSFLKDLVRCCPKACEKFRSWQKMQKNNN